MWIKTQTGRELFNSNQIEQITVVRYNIEGEYKVAARFNSDKDIPSYMLGVYHNIDDAKAVLDKIYYGIGVGSPTFAMPLANKVK